MLGGRYGAGLATIDVSDPYSTYVVDHNGSLTFDRLQFLPSRKRYPQRYRSQPVGNIGGEPPVLTVKDLPTLASLTYSQPDLVLDFALGARATIAGLYISDAQFYSLIQAPNGDVTIEATATFGNSASNYVYAPPTEPPGYYVLHLCTPLFASGRRAKLIRDITRRARHDGYRQGRAGRADHRHRRRLPACSAGVLLG